MADLLQTTPQGLYCPAGDFYVDPWRRVERAIITHAHGDHARWGMGSYLCTPDGAGVLRARVGGEAATIHTLDYGEPLRINGVTVSLHPAGHILGSAQVRIEAAGEVWVVSGDYKAQPDATCRPFEPVRCHTFVTESTFGLPIYRWAPQQEIYDAINAWWRTNRADGRSSLLMGYALGKAQRLLAGLDPSIGPIIVHGAVATLTAHYRAEGVPLPPTEMVQEREAGPHGKDGFEGMMVVAPPSVQGTPWLRRFGDLSTAFASGWMTIRGTRRRRSVDRGFALSDHVDWTDLIGSIRATGAERVLVTHGSVATTVRWLCEHGWDAAPLATLFEGDEEEAASDATSDDATSDDATSDDATSTLATPHAEPTRPRETLVDNAAEFPEGADAEEPR